MEAMPPRSVSPLLAGLCCRCPRCGQGALFVGFLRLAARCPRCGLDYSFADPADGPAFFVMTGVGIAVIAVFTAVEVAYAPPVWLLVITVFPALIIGCLGCLRPVKAWLVAAQYVHKAEPARFEPAPAKSEPESGPPTQP